MGKSLSYPTVGAVILAAGKGTRMCSGRPKVLRLLAGQPMITYPLATLAGLGIAELVVVIGHQAELVKKEVMARGHRVKFAYQREQLGTADAARTGIAVLTKPIEQVMTLNADDSAFLSSQILAALIRTHFAQKADLTILTADLANPGSLGRILRGPDGRVRGVVEAKEASVRELAVTEINTNCYLLKRSWFEAHIDQIQPSRATGEYYLPQLVSLAVANQSSLASLRLIDPTEFIGVNNPDELARADRCMRKRVVANETDA